MAVSHPPEHPRHPSPERQPRQPRHACETVFRRESPRIIAGVTRIVRDVGIAEELAQDALVAALARWPEQGVPENPGAWLMATAKHRAVDLVRRREQYAQKLAEAGRDPETVQTHSDEPADPDAVDDDLLRLVFTACHPLLSAEARVALTLRLLGGLTTAEIARAVLAAEPTVAQRIVRAKRTLAAKGVPFEVPCGAERAARLASVLEVVYLIFNEGYAATAGDDWLRPSLCEEGLRLARVLTGLMPEESEAHGLAALLELQASRAAARTGPDGEPVLLEDQNRARWNRTLIRPRLRGPRAGPRHADSSRALGPYALQAAIAACHARARRTRRPTGRRSPPCTACSPPAPVTGRRAEPRGRGLDGHGPGRRAWRWSTRSPRKSALRDHHLLPSVRGDLLSGSAGRRRRARSSSGRRR